MALKTNINKALKKGEEERARAAAQASFGRQAMWWKPKAGENMIRMLPPWTDTGPNQLQFWREIWLHWGVTSKDDPEGSNVFNIPCTNRTPGASALMGFDPDVKIPCEICNMVEELRGSSDPANSELAKQTRAKMRIYSQIIDIADPTWTQDAVNELKAKGVQEDNLPKVGEAKIQLYSYGPTILNGILDFYQDSIDIADLEEGYNVKIKRDGTGINTDYRVRLEMQPSKAPITEKEWDSKMWNLDELMPFFTEEMVNAVLEGATQEEVRALKPGVKEEQKALPAAKTKKTASEEPEEAVEELETESEVEDEPEQDDAPEEPEVDFPPLDEDGDINFDALKDEQIEDPKMQDYAVKAGTDDEHTPYVECFGAARQRQPEDHGCMKNCGLFDRCGKRIEFLDAEAAKAAAAAKKNRPPARKAVNVEKPAKKKIGKPKAATPAKAAPTGGNSESKKESGTSIEDEMRAALGQ